MLGSWEIILIIFFIVVLFGPNKIPELLKYLQKGKEAFKKGVSDTDDLNIKDNVILNCANIWMFRKAVIITLLRA